MRYFARLNENNIVTEVLSFRDDWSDEKIISLFGRGDTLLETFLDMNNGVSSEGHPPEGRRYRYALPGSKYLPEEDVFTMPLIDPDTIPEGTSIVYDASTYSYYVQYDDMDAIMEAINAGIIDVPEDIISTEDSKMIYG